MRLSGTFAGNREVLTHKKGPGLPGPNLGIDIPSAVISGRADLRQSPRIRA